MGPLVSVIMPTFNRREFLQPAIESLLNQAFAHWELIIADDGSDTDTRSYLHSLHAPPRVKVIYLPHSGRPSVTRNAALREARGEYVAFLDSDDLWLPRKLEMQMTSLARHPQRQWSYTAFALVDCAGQPKELRHDAKRSAPSGWIMERMLKDEIVIALPSVVVARQLLEQLGSFDETLVMCEDDDLWLRLAAHSEIDGIDEPLTLVRRHGQHGGDDITAWRDRLRVFEKGLGVNGNPDVSCILHRLRAEMAGGLARSQARGGMRIGALRTVAASAHYSWRYRKWWLEVLAALGRAFAPAAMGHVVRRYRNGRRAQRR
ncbi:glycosyltransferase family 2 protein [Steroidobacter cummioxidans]|uniref:glycosyltransferase family 2 protein n=1 Tax=Steroidobacter cummioxidans TaxID=1803913 RepID=UPI000E31B00D|nr:glycosyltransferase [Steroidobacter cummioxidans]